MAGTVFFSVSMSLDEASPLTTHLRYRVRGG